MRWGRILPTLFVTVWCAWLFTRGNVTDQLPTTASDSGRDRGVPKARCSPSRLTAARSQSLLGIGLGAALTLLANALLHQSGQKRAVGSVVHESPTRLARSPISDRPRTPTITSVPAPQENSAKAAASGEPELKPAEFRMGGTTLQQDKGLRSTSLNALLNSLAVRCDFDPGADAYWSAGEVHTHGVNYSGGEIVYQSIDIGDGTAQMDGTPGATGSATGELNVRVAANNAGLHFAGFTTEGSLIVTSVYAAVDHAGRYLAVMSWHGQASGHESIQVYGACDIGLSK